MARACSHGVFIALAALMASACTVGPNYHRPAVSVPPTYRGAPASPASTAASFGEEKWWEVFQDPQLQVLIRTALKQNYDVRIAASRILQAQAQLGIARGNQLPTAGAIAAGNDQRLPNQAFLGRMTPATTSSVWPSNGIWISGASTAAPQRPLVTSCWPIIGRGSR